MNEKKYYAASELIINADGSVFHLHVKPKQLADKIILVGDPGRVSLVASNFEEIECKVSNREFHTVTGVYKGKRLTVLSTRNRVRQYRHRPERTRCVSQYRFRNAYLQRSAKVVRTGSHRYLRGAAAKYAGGNLHRQREIDRLGRIAQFLCRPERSLRLKVRTGVH